MRNEADFEDVIRRVRAGAPEAFEVIVRALEWPLRTWVVAHAPPGADADDIAQRTFIEAFKRIAEYRPGTEFRGWIFTIARYQLMAESTRLRRTADYHRRYAPRALADEIERRAAAEPDAKLEHLRLCLQELNPDARDLLSQRYLDGLPLEEIAKRAERSPGALKKYLFTLRARLHECIERRSTAETTG